MKKRALLGLHDDFVLITNEKICRCRDYEVYSNVSRREVFDDFNKYDFNLSIIDPNLEFPGTRNISFALDMRDLIIKRGSSCNVCAISGSDEIYMMLLKAGFKDMSCSSQFRAGLKGHYTINDIFR